VTIAEKREHKRPEHGLVVERLEVINQRGETVLACNHLLLVRRRAEYAEGPTIGIVDVASSDGTPA
jgi:hypothetical protein